MTEEKQICLCGCGKAYDSLRDRRANYPEESWENQMRRLRESLKRRKEIIKEHKIEPKLVCMSPDQIMAFDEDIPEGTPRLPIGFLYDNREINKYA